MIHRPLQKLASKPMRLMLDEVGDRYTKCAKLSRFDVLQFKMKSIYNHFAIAMRNQARKRISAAPSKSVEIEQAPAFAASFQEFLSFLAE